MPFSRVIKQVIALGRQSALATDAELRRRHDRYPFVDPADGPDPSDEKGPTAMERLLVGLPAEQVYALAFLMSLGRGQVEANVSATAAQHMRSVFGTAPAAAHRMAYRASPRI
jgi:hypothetical protein